MKRFFISFTIGWAIAVFLFTLSAIVSQAAQPVNLRSYTAGIAAMGAGHIQGTGFAVATPHGYYVLTNAHVCHISAKKRFRIVFDRGIVTEGKQVALDPNKDLCLIEVPGLNFGLPLAQGFIEGETAYSAGHPHGGAYAERKGVYGEIVSFLIELWEGNTILATRREFHGKVVGGQSGSPVVNAQGEVIGVICCSTFDDEMGSMVMFYDVQNFIQVGAWL